MEQGDPTRAIRQLQKISQFLGRHHAVSAEIILLYQFLKICYSTTGFNLNQACSCRVSIFRQQVAFQTFSNTRLAGCQFSEICFLVAKTLRIPMG